MPRRLLQPASLTLAAALSLSGLSGAQTLPVAPAAAPPADAAPQQVEITATVQPDSQDERRRATASRIVYGREELDRMGDATLGEVLKRLPGVTIGGAPGRGGQISMRGMGGGYTQILLDGQRMAPGFSLDSIAPEQIERIEIMRAPVAEFGARAIAGTINVVMRSDFKRKTNELRIGGGADGQRGQVGATWNYNGQTEALGYNLASTLFKGGQGNQSDSRTLGLDANGSTVLDQRQHSESRNQREGLFANGRLQFRFGPGHTLDLQPFFNTVRTQGDGRETLDQPVGGAPAYPQPYSLATWHSQSQWQMGRLNGTWLTPTPGGGRLQLRFGSTLSASSSVTDRDESGFSAGANRHKFDDARQRELSTDINGKYAQLLGEGHSAVAGWELQSSQRTDSRISTVNGQAILAEFGEDITARVQRVALYAQDEWDLGKRLSFSLGARWEAINTQSDSALNQVNNRSAVFTPLAHMVWKLPDSARDQLRLSLTRSYRSPTTSQLIARPTISPLYPDTDQPNQPTNPDRAGNANLKPELASGLELGLEHYLDAGGIVSANIFARKIDGLIRTVRSLETVSYASVPRWVARPQNIGSADAAGLELEAKSRLTDLWTTELPISLRANFTLMWSRVGQVPGPNNRIEGQPPYTTNLGADWPLRAMPLTVGASLNFTPSFVLQQIESQTYRQGVKRVLDGYALWRFNPDASARLTLSNVGARRYDTGSTTRLADANGAFAGSQSADVSARSYTTVNLRGEFRF
jgi:outer membrane receptor for ferrienterochelin and colicins